MTKAELITDVYEELLKCEAEGTFAVLRYKEQSSERQKELINLIAGFIAQANYFEDDKEQQDFMKKYFKESWEIAVEKQ